MERSSGAVLPCHLWEVKHGVAERLALDFCLFGLGHPDSHNAHPHQEKSLSAVRGENQGSGLEVPLLRL